MKKPVYRKIYFGGKNNPNQILNGKRICIGIEKIKVKSKGD